MQTEVTAERVAEYRAVLERVAGWAAQQPDVRAVAVVGSWARGTPRMDSDVDVVVLTDRTQRYAEREDWVAAAAGEAAPVVRSQAWGELRERRVRLASGFEVEFGFVHPGWARTVPVASGPAKVACGGMVRLYDPAGILGGLLRAL
jgi:predicted nucleotidyltransferase